MDLGTVFKLSLYGLTALVGAILGAAEGEGSASSNTGNDLVLPFLSLPIVVCGYLLTERRRRDLSTKGTGLSSVWANVLGIIALGATAYEFFSENREGKLLAGTHLLLYATWIVLFQQKTVRLYWFLMALGILQLAVASVLTTKGWFGFCAVAYMFGAVWTLSIFSLWRAEQFFEEEDLRRLAETSAGQHEVTVWSSLPEKPQSEVRSAVQHEDGTRWLTVRFSTGVLMTTCSALLVSSAFFIFIPRMWVGAEVTLQDDQDPTSGLARKTGLATSVRLGDFGSILESMEPVFEIRIFNLRTGRTMSAQEYADHLGLAEPLFRGTVFTAYEKGRWSADLSNTLISKGFERPSMEVDIRQEIRMEPNSTEILYCLGQPLAMADSKHNPFGDFNEITGIAFRADRRIETAAFEYEAFTLLPATHPENYKLRVSPTIRELYRRINYREVNMRLPSGLPHLKELTQNIIEKETARRQRAEGRETPRKLTSLEIATALEFHLRDSGQYKYSLDLSIVDSKIDPVEDFLTNRKLGHCEYFATTLALMLRAAKIPARVVSGYKGGMPKPHSTHLLQVQQRFAHLWVEAWVDDDGWTTFDATPADERSLSVASVSAKKTSIWAGVQTTLSGLWSENVLNMTLDRQEESIYKPIRELAYSMGKVLHQLVTSPKSALPTLWDLLSNRERWFSVGGGIFVFVFLLSLAAFVWLVRWAMIRIRTWLKLLANSRSRQHRRAIEFYERFVKLMKSRGLVRQPTQTQHEFAEQVTSSYSPELNATGLREIPALISKLFYQVRFGDQELSVADLDELQKVLGKLESTLSNDASRGRSAGTSQVT